MDAKITKQRLSNLLSYDWLKMIIAIAAVIFALILIFTMTATNPTNAQTFTIYGYTDVRMGSNNATLEENLTARKTFSYDILQITTESFYGNSYSGATFSARRAAGEGTVMFISSFDAEGNHTVNSELCKQTYENLYSGPGTGGGYYQPQYFFETEVGNYLKEFFGEDLSGALNEDKALARFTERNGKDKRFRNASQKAQGFESEKARLNKLRDDYITLRTAFEENVFSYTAIDTREGETQGQIVRLGWGEPCPEGYYIASVDLSGVKGISSVFYYTDQENKATGESVNLLVFRNSHGKAFDLCYETVSFLTFLSERYATV